MIGCDMNSHLLLLLVCTAAWVSADTDPRNKNDIEVSWKPGKDGSVGLDLKTNTGFNKLLKMLQNRKLDSKTRVFSFKNNAKTEEPHTRGCYHQDEKRQAALNLCSRGGVEGVVNDDSGVMEHIRPHKIFRTNHTREEEEAKGMAERRRRSAGSSLHQLTRIKRDLDETSDFKHHIDLNENELHSRLNKRQSVPPEVEVELAFVADFAMYTRLGSNVQAAKDYILSVANVIGLLYQTVTYPKVTISVSSIYIFTDASSQSWIQNVLYSDGETVESGDLLDAFSTWLPSAPIDDNYDHAMLLSGLDFCSPTSSGTCSMSNSGLAWVSNACSLGSSKTYASSVSEEHGGYSRIFTIAHELGHNLGAAHDGSSNSMGGPGATSCAKSDGYIMGSPKTHHEFSTCSTEQFQYYFGLSQANCLQTSNANSLETIPSELPGSSIPLDVQCQNLYGLESAKCSWKDTDICQSLWCKSSSTGCGSWGSALMGSPCDGGFCWAGECVSSIPGSETVDRDGGWTSWGSYGKCSVTCGGGTQTRTRSCSNPYPSGNGAQCTGATQQTISCNPEECPSDPCALPDATIPSGCSDYNVIITYGSSTYDCKCFYKQTGSTFCGHTGLQSMCCESWTRVC